MHLATIDWQALWETPEMLKLMRVCVLTLGMIFLIWLGSYALSKLLVSRSSLHYRVLTRKLIFYLGSLVVLITILVELGFNLTGVIATAGVASVAIGFAAQTSLSNLISGLFLVGEQPFRIGDLIRVDSILGVVESIDLLSVKIRTLDNLFIRIPNESMIKNPVTTVTRYPIRRMDLDIGVAYKEDVGQIMRLLKELAAGNPLILDHPEPLILFNQFGDSALEFKFGIWFEKSNYLLLRNSIMKEIKERFDKEDIEIPFPHLTIYSGSDTGPFPVQMTDRGSRSS